MTGFGGGGAEQRVTFETPTPTRKKKWRQLLADLEKGSSIPLRWSRRRALQKEAVGFSTFGFTIFAR
jgi:hypothetical protein